MALTKVSGDVIDTQTTVSVGSINVGTGASISSPSSNVLSLGVNNTEEIRITTTGVGIGTNTITKPFEVWAGTAGTSFSIDSSGRVQMPYQTHFLVYNNAASAIVGPTTATYNVERFDINNSMNISTGKFTAPIEGLYFFSFHSLAEINNTSLIQVLFRKNGSALNYTRSYDEENVGVAYGPTSNISTIEKMSVNDTMEVYFVSGSSHGNMNGQFFGYLIG